MKAGAENRTKTIALGVLGAIALCGVLYNVSGLFDGPSTPPAAVAPVAATPATSPRSVFGNRSVPDAPVAAGQGATTNSSGATAVPGVAAQRLASTSSSLDPTLDQAAMLRTESLTYSGSGRNIFSALYVPPPMINVPRNVPPPRPIVQPPTPPAYTGPPPPAPIPLKFFGTAQRGNAGKQAFLLSGDDVYLASPGDIVAKRFRVGQISSFGVQVTDLSSNNTQNLPLQQ